MILSLFLTHFVSTTLTAINNMNAYFVVSCVLALVGLSRAYPHAAIPLAPIAVLDTLPNPNYAFNYAVNDPHTGDHKSQWETRHGDVVRGSYSLADPDGTTRIVEYTADDHNGFNAVVKKIGTSVHSVAPLAHHAPIVHAPLVHTPIVHAPVVPATTYWGHTQFHPSPLLTHVHVPEHLPLYQEPLTRISGSTYGHHGLEHQWSAGPISLDGKTLIIRHRH